MKKPTINFHIVTILPKVFSYFKESIIKKAQEKNIISINIYNLRDYTTDKHKTVDDKPAGGGVGMIMKVEPFYKAVKHIKGRKKKTRIILTSAKGKIFTQKDAQRLTKYKHLIILCGRYEGVDERVAQYIADEELSIGKYVLSGGELPAMVMVDSISRLIPGVISKTEALKEESYTNNYLEYPQYTKPTHFQPNKKQTWSIPSILLSGNHKKIKQWREKNKKIIK